MVRAGSLRMTTLYAPVPFTRIRFGLLYAWSGFAVLWLVWIAFVIFLCEPRRLLSFWPLPTIDHGAAMDAPLAALIDLSLIAMFGLQHSVMARPWFKQRVMGGMPAAFERCTYVHTANLVLLILILCWQPIPASLWQTGKGVAGHVLWGLFAMGWLILFAGAWSFGIRELLGISQMRAWLDEQRHPLPRLKTGLLYRWLRHPMYVGVLLGVWATPRMSFGHAVLALGLTGYVLIGMRHEERDLERKFGAHYRHWREPAH